MYTAFYSAGANPADSGEVLKQEGILGSRWEL